MIHLKRFSGILWMVLALVAGYLVFQQAKVEFGKTPTLDTRIFWYTILPVFLPILFGLGLFGWYCWKGEYGSLKSLEE